MSPAPQPRLFASPPPRHTLTLTRGEKVWRFAVRPWVLGASVASLALLAVGCAGSTTLFLMSDDIASAFRDREARTVSAYEQRIADLRRELDRAASREHSERQTVVASVETMLHRQREIEVRYAQMEPLLAEARLGGLIPNEVPVPIARPSAGDAPLSAFARVPEPVVADPFEGFDLRVEMQGAGWRSDWAEEGEPIAVEEIGAKVVADVRTQVEVIEQSQVGQLSVLADAAEARAAEIAGVISGAGLAAGEASSGMGGPFLPAPADDPFSEGLHRLSDALSHLRETRDAATSLPLGAPIAGSTLSSNFGIRRDPFIGRRALHAGVDYAAASGTLVFASAAGRVLRAGRRGGYGLVVEIDHEGGHVTRYAHLSSIDVEAGQEIGAGEAVGRVGSTGRSTGPHLHYEVRRGGKAVDPRAYLEAGARLDALL